MKLFRPTREPDFRIEYRGSFIRHYFFWFEEMLVEIKSPSTAHTKGGVVLESLAERPAIRPDEYNTLFTPGRGTWRDDIQQTYKKWLAEKALLECLITEISFLEE